MNEIVARLEKLYEKMRKDFENGEFPSIYDIEEIKTISIVLKTVYIKEAK